MTAKQCETFEEEPEEENTAEDFASSETLVENQIYDLITNQPVKDNPRERILQVVARSLVDEYGFDHTQLVRDQTIIYELPNENGKISKTRRKVDIAVYPENPPKEGPRSISNPYRF